MPPVCLLFSSDPETSGGLAQALQELELEVEPCPDVFAAVEWLISKSFDVIVADCDCGPEAAFLLKNARDLKLNKAAFTLAVTSVSSKLLREEAGADLVLTKPLTPEQIKYALLGDERFLGCMKTWIARGDMARAPETTRHEARPVLLDQPSPLPQTIRSDSPFPARLGQAGDGTPRPTHAPAPKRGKFLSGIALGVAFVCVGYVAGQSSPMQSVFASVATACRQALETKSGRRASAKNPANPSFSETAQAAASRNLASGKYPPSRVSVVDAHPIPVPNQTPLPPAETSQTEAHLAPQLFPEVATPNQIPESLRAPVPEAADVRPVSTKRPVSLLGQMEPVTLSEDSAHELLLEQVQPSYPERALKAGLQGAVVLQAWIGKDGSIQDLKLINGPLLLGQAAVKAVRQWRYKPYLRNGVAVDAETYITVNFKLP